MSLSTSLELKLPPPLVAVVLAAAMYGATAWLPQWGWVWPVWLKSLLAGACVVAGVLVAALAALDFRRRRTTLHPLRPQDSTRLVTTGVMRYSRNPMYLGMVLCLLGWAIWLAHPLAFAGPPLAVAWLQRFQIQPEERALLQKFGAPYAQYLRQVRRWI